MLDADQLKRDFAKLLLDHIRENIGKVEPRRFLPEIRRNLERERVMVPKRDPVLDAEIVYEDILDAEVIDGEFEGDPWATVRLTRMWKINPMSLLVIGGKSDGRRVNIPGDVHRWRLTAEDEYRRLKLAATEPDSPDGVKYFSVLVHATLSDADAMEKLLNNYRP